MRTRADMDSRTYYWGVRVTDRDGNEFDYATHPDGHCLYTVWDADEVLLYVGIADCDRATDRDEVRGRISKHRKTHWGDRIDHVVVFQGYPTRAEEPERRAIRRLHPLWNTSKVPKEHRALQAVRRQLWLRGEPLDNLLSDLD